MASTYQTGLDPLAEQRLLLMELDHVRSEWPVGATTFEAILGLAEGSLPEAGRAPLPHDAEAQMRRLLEVARLANVLMGAGAYEWLLSAEAALGFASPLETMRRPGGLTYVRDLLRDAWENVAITDRPSECRP